MESTKRSILLAHGYYIEADPKEKEVMKPYPTLGLLYISAYLKSRGIEVEFFDSTFRHPDEFEPYIKKHQPRFVGLYSNLMTRPQILRQVKICKKYGAFVIVGGPDPANYLEEYLTHGVDVVVIGEGEETLRELLEFGPDRKEEVKGLAFLNADGEVQRTLARPYIEDLDSLPFPDREAIDMNRYVETWRTHHGRGSASLITARGCPYTCTWCSHAVYGYSHRRRSPENVVDEVEHIIATYNPDMIWYADDVFTIKPSWLRKYAAELKRRNIRIPFETITREDRLNEEVAGILQEMGCFRIWIGSESGSQRILDAMKRRTDAARVQDMIRLLQKHDIEAGLFIMLGYEGEEESDLEETVDLLKAAPPDVFLTTLSYPIKGTPYYKEVEDRVIAMKEWHEGSDRDFTIAGRKSKRYYRHANRWMVHEVAYERARTRAVYPRMASSFVKAKIGRLGMWATRGEIEEGL